MFPEQVLALHAFICSILNSYVDRKALHFPCNSTYHRLLCQSPLQNYKFLKKNDFNVIILTFIPGTYHTA